MPRVLIIDDDTELCELLREYLSREGFEIDAVHDGESGLSAILRLEPDLVVLDVMLPRIGGFDLLRSLRTRSRVPVLMLTARGEEVDRIVGLEIGADDYLPKPFNPRELVARIRAILRRAAEPADPSATVPSAAGSPVAPARSLVREGNLEIDPGAREVRRGSTRLDLTAVEFDILHVLARSAGSIVDRNTLCREALGREYQPLDRSLDVHVSNLRRKLGPGSESLIKTVRSAGYLLVRPARGRPSSSDGPRSESGDDVRDRS